MIAGLVATAAVNAYNKTVAALVPFIVPMDGGVDIDYDSNDVNPQAKSMIDRVVSTGLYIGAGIGFVMFVFGLIKRGFGKKGDGIMMIWLGALVAVVCFVPTETGRWVVSVVRSFIGL